MFRKLRLKLTLINVLIMLSMFLLLATGTYFFSVAGMTRHADFFAKKIVTDIQSGKLRDMPQHRLPPELIDNLPPPPPAGKLVGPIAESIGAPPPGPLGKEFFFVKTAADGAVKFNSSGSSLSDEKLAVLTAAVLKLGTEKGTLTFEQNEYAYYKEPRSDEPGTLVLLRDLSGEKSMLNTMLTALLIVGLTCSLLSFAASFFLANKAMVPIVRSWQQQSDFLSDASHELRTPLTVIQTNLDIVRSCDAETVASQDKWLANIQEEVRQMTKMVDSLLFLARADTNQQLLEMNLFSLAGALRSAVVPFEAYAAARGIILEIPAMKEILVYGDEGRLKQVINILVDNAIRHTAPGGRVSLNLSQSQGKTILCVTDTGEGIAPEYAAKIFDRFYQADSSRNKGGTGLGLSIAKLIVENHGGIIAVDSIPGDGTTFTVTLPRENIG